MEAKRRRWWRWWWWWPTAAASGLALITIICAQVCCWSGARVAKAAVASRTHCKGFAWLIRKAKHSARADIVTGVHRVSVRTDVRPRRSARKFCEAGERIVAQHREGRQTRESNHGRHSSQSVGHSVYRPVRLWRLRKPSLPRVDMVTRPRSCTAGVYCTSQNIISGVSAEEAHL